MCFFAGGMRFSEQGFGVSATQLNSSLLTVSVIAVLLPAAFHFSVPELDDATEARDILAVSHGVAIVLLVIYLAYLVFQLFSHTNLYADEGEHIFKSTGYNPDKKKQFKSIGKKLNKAIPFSRSSEKTKQEGGGETTELNQRDAELESASHAESEVETPAMNLWVSIGALVGVTVLVAVTAEWLVDSIDGLTETGHISKEFVGMILLPIVGNAAEHLTAVTVSVKDKLTLSLGVAVGSSIVSVARSERRRHTKSDYVGFILANRTLRHSVHRDTWMDTWEALDSSFRPLRVCCALPLCPYCQLRRARRQVELA